jgi:hypothetical protein
VDFIANIIAFIEVEKGQDIALQLAPDDSAGRHAGVDEYE